ncbi:MAG: ATP-binding cassette domain-containing protein [Bauldia sp.]
MTALLEVAGLGIRADDGRPLVAQLSFAIGEGERIGLVGESGSGKSLTALAVTGLLPPGLDVSGSVRLDGEEVIGAPERRLRRLRGASVATVFQEPLTALDPLMRLGHQVLLPLRRRLRREGRRVTRRALREATLALLDEVALPDPLRIARAFPHEVSGGQRQRVAIAMALACRAKLLIADEPTTALDVTTQAEILALIDRLAREHRMALLFVSHDLAVVSRIAERVIVLREGRAVAEGPVAKVFASPADDYTRTLIEAARRFDRVLDGAG